VKNEIKDNINRRFFLAVSELVNAEKVPSLNAFCLENGLSAPRFRECRLGYGPGGNPARSRYDFVGVESLYYIALKYRINADWLITGRGSMFAK